jgi:hypothetical protein
MATNTSHRHPLWTYRRPVAAVVIAGIASVLATVVSGTGLSVNLLVRFPASLMALAVVGPEPQAMNGPAAELIVGGSFLLFLAAQVWLAMTLVRSLREYRAGHTLTSDSR